MSWSNILGTLAKNVLPLVANAAGSPGSFTDNLVSGLGPAIGGMTRDFVGDRGGMGQMAGQFAQNMFGRATGNWQQPQANPAAGWPQPYGQPQNPYGGYGWPPQQPPAMGSYQYAPQGPPPNPFPSPSSGGQPSGFNWGPPPPPPGPAQPGPMPPSPPPRPNLQLLDIPPGYTPKPVNNVSRADGLPYSPTPAGPVNNVYSNTTEAYRPRSGQVKYYQPGT